MIVEIIKLIKNTIGKTKKSKIGVKINIVIKSLTQLSLFILLISLLRSSSPCKAGFLVFGSIVSNCAIPTITLFILSKGTG